MPWRSREPDSFRVSGLIRRVKPSDREAVRAAAVVPMESLRADSACVEAFYIPASVKNGVRRARRVDERDRFFLHQTVDARVVLGIDASRHKEENPWGFADTFLFWPSS